MYILSKEGVISEAVVDGGNAILRENWVLEIISTKGPYFLQHLSLKIKYLSFLQRNNSCKNFNRVDHW